jgi:hypothetical protein
MRTGSNLVQREIDEGGEGRGDRGCLDERKKTLSTTRNGTEEKSRAEQRGASRIRRVVLRA